MANNKLATFAIATGLIMASIQPSLAAQYYDEEDFGPSYGTMVADTVVGKPLQAIAAVGGTAAFLVSYPFSLASGSNEMAAEKLVREPWQALSNRCLGCTEAEGNYYNLKRLEDDGYVRMVITEPSEVLIKTDDNVIINDMTGTVSH